MIGSQYYFEYDTILRMITSIQLIICLIIVFFDTKESNSHSNLGC